MLTPLAALYRRLLGLRPAGHKGTWPPLPRALPRAPEPPEPTRRSPTIVLGSVREVPEATPQELWEAFGHTASYHLGLSGEEFLRRLDANEISRDDLRVQKVLRRIDLVRPDYRPH